jgi:HPt (histidine-containing phosphotransfer) domain-containing protein
LFTILCSSFLQESEEKEANLEQAVNGQDWQGAMVAAHAIKNSAGLLCAVALQNAADKIEADCRAIVEAYGDSGKLLDGTMLADDMPHSENAQNTSHCISKAVSNLTTVMTQTRVAIAGAIKEVERG